MVNVFGIDDHAAAEHVTHIGPTPDDDKTAERRKAARYVVAVGLDNNGQIIDLDTTNEDLRALGLKSDPQVKTWARSTQQTKRCPACRRPHRNQRHDLCAPCRQKAAERRRELAIEEP